MIPDVEEIRREFEVLVFRDAEVLADGHIPVLLERSAESIAAESTEACSSIHSDHRSSNNRIGIEELIDPAVNVTMGLRRRDGNARSQTCRTGVRAAQSKVRASGGVDDGEGGP